MSAISENGLFIAFDVKDEKFSDCTIKSSDDMEFKLHRVILARRCEYFRKLFNNSRLNLSQIKFPEDREVLKQIFKFIYGGAIDENFEDILTLAKTAKKFEIKELGKFCDQKLISNLSAENAIDLLIFSSNFNAEMENHVLRFIAKSAKQVRETEGWKLLDADEHKDLKLKVFDTVLNNKEDDMESMECWKITVHYPLSSGFNGPSKRVCYLPVRPDDTIAWVKKAFLKIKAADPEIDRHASTSLEFYFDNQKLKDTDIASDILKCYDTIIAKFPKDNSISENKEQNNLAVSSPSSMSISSSRRSQTPVLISPKRLLRDYSPPQRRSSSPFVESMRLAARGYKRSSSPAPYRGRGGKRGPNLGRSTTHW